MTSVRAAGYSSRGRPGPGSMLNGTGFDPMNQARAGLEPKSSEGLITEDHLKSLEKKVNQLIEESTIATADGNLQVALEKAKEAGKRERQLTKQREQLYGLDPNNPNNPNNGGMIMQNLDLTYSVLFNLATCYQACKMYQEALNSYAVIVKNKLFNQSGRLRVNMGNIYFEQRKFGMAVKMYRMALDQIPSTNKEIRLKIMRNIGIAFVRIGQFQDAITSFEAIMEGNADFNTGFNLILCYFALGDKDRMKKGFQRLVSIRPVSIDQSEDMMGGGGSAATRLAATSPTGVGGGSAGATGVGVTGIPGTEEDVIEDHEVFNEDSLRSIARDRRKAAERYILLAAKLLAPAIDNTFSAGYDWIVETIKSSPHSEIASELEIAKSIEYLKTKEFGKAIESLKAFEKRMDYNSKRLVGTAATNLSFLYLLECGA
ncbi:Intraflagellar transport protein 88, partial [Quaeritorhiza haematococci]